MKIITAGESYYDIDVLACAFAYKELMDLMKEESIIVLRGNQTLSIPSKYKNIKVLKDLPSNYNEDKDEFVLIDISTINHVAKFVVEDKITEIYDHHFGFGDNWDSVKNAKIRIERVGSCATLIYELFKENNLENRISSFIAELICYAIISNTLNLQSSNTSIRDINAYKELKVKCNFNTNTISNYYKYIDSSFINNPINTLKSDYQELEINNIKFLFFQVELWDFKSVNNNNLDSIINYLNSLDNKEWVLTIPSINEGVNYILFSNNSKIVSIFKSIINISIIDNNIYKTDKIFLRKEIKELLFKI